VGNSRQAIACRDQIVGGSRTRIETVAIRGVQPSIGNPGMPIARNFAGPAQFQTVTARTSCISVSGATALSLRVDDFILSVGLKQRGGEQALAYLGFCADFDTGIDR